MIITAEKNEVVTNITASKNFKVKASAKAFKILSSNIYKDKITAPIRELICNAVDSHIQAGTKQVNIHQLVSEETYDDCMRLIEQIKSDKRLSKLNAVVFLMLKPKGVRNDFSLITNDKYDALIQKCLSNNISFGMDSCSACAFRSVVKNRFDRLIEPCESFGLFSCYFNVDGKYFPCSFCEGEKQWEKGLDIKDDFLQDIWYHPKLVKDRELSLKVGRKCIMYDLLLK